MNLEPTRDEADHLARRITHLHAVGTTDLARAERRAQRWQKRYTEEAKTTSQLRDIIDEQNERIEELVQQIDHLTNG